MRQFLVFAIVFAVAFRRAVVAVRLVREPVLPVRLAVGIGFAVHATLVDVRVVDRRLRRRRRRGLARRGRHVVRIGMGLALMVQIDAINDRVVLVAVRGLSAAIRIPRAVFVDVVVLVGMALLATPIFLVLVTLVAIATRAEIVALAIRAVL